MDEKKRATAARAEILKSVPDIRSEFEDYITQQIDKGRNPLLVLDIVQEAICQYSEHLLGPGSTAELLYAEADRMALKVKPRIAIPKYKKPETND